MKEPKRVLQISIGMTVFGGVEQMLYQIYKNIDKKKIQFDFLSPNLTTYEIHKNEILNYGGKIIELKANRNNLKGKLLYNIRLYKFLKKNKYEIVHINSGVFLFVFQVAFMAKLCGVKKIIVHSHNAIKIKNKFKRNIINILKHFLHGISTDNLACSELAAKSMFLERDLKDVKIIKNGIDIQKYKFNSEIRNKYRQELGIKKNIVYGHIGRFETQKNHEFLIDIFYEIQKKQPEAVLLLIGEGNLKNKIINKVEELKITEKVKFLNLRQDVPELLQAMDCFILPSLYEGLPVVGIEAQTSGLPLICSETITNELKLLNNTKFILLNDDATVWAEEICKSNYLENTEKRKEAYKMVKAAGYDIKAVSKEVEKIYTD